MKPKFKIVLKGIFASSIAALFPLNSEGNIYNLESLNTDDKKQQIKDSKVDLSPKLLIRFNDDDSYSTNSHRSHRSHSSHRSHYSSTTTTRKSTTTKKSTTRYNNNTSSQSKLKAIDINTISLGDRIITKNIQGNDVTELVNILIKLGYIKIEDGKKEVTGLYTYKGEIIRAIKKFQKANQIKVDGIVGTATIYKLKQKVK